MSALMVRAKVKADRVDDVESAAKRVFAELDDAGHDNVRYASCKLPDGVTFVALLQVSDGTESPLPGLSTFQAFQAVLQEAVDGPPAAEPIDVVGSYRLFD